MVEPVLTIYCTACNDEGGDSETCNTKCPACGLVVDDGFDEYYYGVLAS